MIPNLRPTPQADFFPEWQINPDTMTHSEALALDRVKENYLDLLEDPPLLENTVKLVILAPLLDLAGLYRRPYRIQTETSIAIELENEGAIVRGRIDILVLNQALWLVVIESKRSDFSVSRAIAQTLSYMLSNSTQTITFGLITNGTEFLFLKSQTQPDPSYATSRLFL
ncbi:type I restriction enzyme HsdR N-terminal domain-containing protein [Spirulina major]|uniref:type I restriction enzyme HsdR N-terminal domain-containing protein n=1 Tax=Spirulina major TaxID=270636 RepID=UPI001C316E98|nr:type I restriction enzyme HsdR N-terminal domain-containing protein [Spirulina major]